MTEHYSLVCHVLLISSSSPSLLSALYLSLAVGGQDVGDMRVEGRTLAASDLKSHPAGKPWNSQDRGHHGAGSRTGSRGGQPQQLGGMDTQLISFSWQRQTAINANALQKPRGFCRENF